MATANGFDIFDPMGSPEGQGHGQLPADQPLPLLKFEDLDFGMITPYNFFSASKRDLDKVRAGSEVKGPLASIDGLQKAYLDSLDMKTEPVDTIPVVRRRRPSATITSATATITTASAPEAFDFNTEEIARRLPNTSVTTVKTEKKTTVKTTTTTVPYPAHAASTNPVHPAHAASTNPVHPAHAASTNPVHAASTNPAHAASKIPVRAASTNPAHAPNTNAAGVPSYMIDALFPPIETHSFRTAPLARFYDDELEKPLLVDDDDAPFNPLIPDTVARPNLGFMHATTVGKADTAPPLQAPLRNRKHVKGFTPFQLEEFNHQIQMYNLANQFSINTKKAHKVAALEPVMTRSRGAAAAVTNEVIDLSTSPAPPEKGRKAKAPPKPRTPRGKAKVNLDPLPPPTPSPKAPRGRKPKAAQAQDLTLTPPIPSPLRKPRSKSSPKVNGRRAAQHFPDSPPLQIVFVDCTFCAVSIPSQDTLSIESCQHVFCRDCLRNFIENSTAPQIACPVSDEGKCNGVLSDPEIKELVSEEVFEQYLSRSLASALAADNQLTPCFAPGCTGICVVEGARLFYCPLCSKLNCLDCKATHDGSCMKRTRRQDGGGGAEDASAPLSPGDETVIAMKPPAAETEEEAKIRVEWEASWAQLVSKFKSDKAEAAVSKPPSPSAVFGDLITTDHVFECPICIVDVEVGEGVILQDCFHRFCRDCLAGSIEHSEEIRVKCPYQSGNYSCQMHISDREVRSLASAEVYDKLLKKSLAAAEMGMSNAFHCQSVNCTGWAEIDSNQVLVFRCFICGKNNCVTCKAIHDTLTCAEYQSKLKEGEFELASKEALNRMINNGEAMKCPTCKVVIIKNGGCDGMTCVVCQTHICWATKGPRWGPKGRGDDSAGCRCGFNGKKCHPNCGNCH